MALSRRANPLLDVTGGLLTIATLLLKAGDAWSEWVLQVSTGGHFTQRLELALDMGSNAAAAVVLVFGILAILLSLVQAVLMLFRQVSLIILAGVLPLAAAGSIAPLTRAWVRKVTAWMLALICYKPAAAAVYAAAFTLIGSGGSARTALMGFVMLVLSVLTLPALMRFFTWATGTIGAPNISGGQLLGAATMGAVAIGAMRGGGGAAVSAQAAHLDSHLNPPSGPSGGGNVPPSSPPPSPSGPGGNGPGGPGPQSSEPPSAGGGGNATTAARPRWPYLPASSPSNDADRSGSPAGAAGAATQASTPTSASGADTATSPQSPSGAAPAGGAPTGIVRADGAQPTTGDTGQPGDASGSGSAR